MPDTLKVGDPIVYRPGFGMELPVMVKVVALTVTGLREKDGVEVEDVEWYMVEQNRCLMCFDNGHWGYSDQIDLGPSLDARLAVEAKFEELPTHLGKHPAIDNWIDDQLRKKQEETQTRRT